MRFLSSLLFIFLFALKSQASDCVQIYYDRGPEGYWMGKTYSIFIQNLLGHWPEVQQIVSPIEEYKKGELNACPANIYIGSYFENKIPQAFYEDYVTTKSRVAWLGYSIWKLGPEKLKEALGAEYVGLTVLDKKNLDPQGHPSFYKFITYKGETFFKFGDWDRQDATNYLAPFEQVVLNLDADVTVISKARHSHTGNEIPYIIRKQNRFYVADVPLSFIHEADRYMIFADLLFDILNKPEKRKQKYAFVRLEDVHSHVPLSDLYGFLNVTKEEKIPFSISLIPIFFDPLNRYDRPATEEFFTMDRKREFLEWLKEAQRNQASIIWHGVTHQYLRKKNPHDGASGSDFEFWDAINNKPVREDSAPWVLKRLFDGLDVFFRAGLKAPRVWLTPHYQASPLDYQIFARVFQWNVGRVIYYNHTAQGVPDLANKGQFELKDLNADQQKKRIKAFSQVKINYESDRWNGQMFPYEIYGDIHGQRLIPENLGNSQPFMNAHVVRPRSVQEMVADAKRNRVLRDVWASFFYHPFLLDSYEFGGRGMYPGDPRELQFLIRKIKKLGYTFISLDEFVNNNTRSIRPEPIVRGSKP